MLNPAAGASEDNEALQAPSRSPELQQSFNYFTSKQYPFQMQQKHPHGNKFERLLTGELSLRRTFGRFIDGGTLLELLLVNRATWKALTEQPDLLSCLYYYRMLHLDKSMYYDFYYDDRQARLDRERTATACSNVEGGFLPNMKRCRSLKRELRKNLFQLVEDEAVAEAISDRIFRILREPDLPLPKLRKDTIGNYCETPLQTHMALLSWEGRIPQPIEEPFAQLQKAIIQREEQILQQVSDAGQEQLLELRHRSELIQSYSATGSPFLNLLLLLAVAVENHLDSLKKLMATQSGHLYDNFVEFNLRYSCYRYSVVQLEEQLGFLFEHFNYLFDLLLLPYSQDPLASLWRLMLKKWLNAMGDQHPRHCLVYSYLTAKEREMFMAQQALDEQLFSQDSRCKLANAAEYSRQFYSKQLEGLALDEYFEGPDGLCYREVLLRDYREYLFDISLNELRVHWCGHSNHSVGRPYRQLEDELLRQNCDYFHHVAGILGNVPLLKGLLEREVVFLGDRLKLMTLVKFVKQWEKLLEAEKQRYPELEEECALQYTLDDFDEEIEYLNQQRQLPRELDAQQRMFYDLTEHVTREALQQLARDRQEEDSEDGRSVESYVSSEDS